MYQVEVDGEYPKKKRVLLPHEFSTRRKAKNWIRNHKYLHSGMTIVQMVSAEDMAPDWDIPCEVCGASPTVPQTGMCGPCTFGEADTVGGNW